MMANQIDDEPSLPDGFIQFEYLEFTGTQYINTLITPVLSDEIEFECIVKEHSVSQYAIFGSGSSDLQWVFVGNLLKTQYFGGHYKYFETGAARLSTYIKQHDDALNVINCKNDGYFYVNGVKYFIEPNAFNDVILNTPLYIGTRGNLTMTFTGIIGKFKLMDKNGKLKLNLIPALRIADSKPGMYDLVSRQFLVNQGTGEFGYKIAPSIDNTKEAVNTIIQSVIDGNNIDNMDELFDIISYNDSQLVSVNSKLEEIINT